MKLTPKSWRDFQHYKDRNPPWIRLHKSLLDNFDFQRLPVASRALAPMLWLLASDSVDGVIDADPEVLAFRLRMTVEEVTEALGPLIRKGFFSPIEPASAVLAERKQLAVPETETEALQRQITPPTPSGGAFDAFWQSWPAHSRKVARSQCLKKWQTKGCDAIHARVIAALEAAKRSDVWLKDSGAFIPSPLVWLNQARWEGMEEAAEAWHEGKAGVLAKAKELGMPKWDEIEQWVFYKARVLQAAQRVA